MRRSTALVLVLVNGGMVLGAGYGAWRRAHAPDCSLPGTPAPACETRLASSGSSHFSGGHGSYTGAHASFGSAESATTASARGGFGGTAAHLSGGG